jgi:hypothetical protein
MCCQPLTCAAYEGECGTQDNGCGGTLNCNSNCASGEVCNVDTCCTPLTCAGDYDGECGMQDNGCGGTLDCDSNCVDLEMCNAEQQCE